MKQQVLDCFAKLFGGEGDIRTYFAPGRVNRVGGPPTNLPFWKLIPF